jgi:hypothetical protein
MEVETQMLFWPKPCQAMTNLPPTTANAGAFCVARSVSWTCWPQEVPLSRDTETKMLLCPTPFHAMQRTPLSASAGPALVA